MLGNGVSGVLWSRFNHEDLRLSTRKQTAHSAFTLQLGRVDVAPVTTRDYGRKRAFMNPHLP